jgi:hypothetical protein
MTASATRDQVVVDSLFSIRWTNVLIGTRRVSRCSGAGGSITAAAASSYRSR